MRPNPFAEYRDQLNDRSTGELDMDLLVRAVMQIVLARDEALDLSNLRSIRTSDDYPALISAIAKEVGQAHAPTERQDGNGMAMVIHGPDGDVVALHAGLLHAVFGPDGEYADLSLGTVHHELSHVHDWTVKTRNIGLEAYTSLPVGLPNYMFPFAEMIWAEYFAERRSYPSMPDGKSVHGDLLATTIPKVAGTVEAALVRARMHNDPIRLLQDVYPDVSFLLKLAAYVLGALAGADMPLAEEYPAVGAAITGSYLEHAWPALATRLNEMYASHGEWSGVVVYRPLEDVVQSIFARLGLVFSLRENGVVHLRPNYSVRSH